MNGLGADQPMIGNVFLNSAAEYGKYWLTKERAFVDGLASSNRSKRLAALQAAGGYFKIARSFGLSYDVERGLARLEPVLTATDGVPAGAMTEGTLCQVIREFRRELGRPYGNKDLLSAATKFLWLRHRDVVIIHDSQARQALGASYGDYDGYVALWHSAYTREGGGIALACRELASQPGWMGTELREIAAQEWFQRRVFDIHMWRAGAP